MIRRFIFQAPPSGAMAALAGFLILTSLACFEEPVRELLALRFQPDGSVEIRIEVQLASAETVQNQPRVRERVEGLRQSLREGRNSWDHRLEALGSSPAERLVWEKQAGLLRRYERSFLLEEAERIRDLFDDSLIEASFQRGEGWQELLLVPGPGSRATFRQQEEVRRRFGEWVKSLQIYLSAVSELYGYLEQRPQRARSCLAGLFWELMDPPPPSEPGELDEREQALVEAVGDSLEGALAPLQIPPEAARSREDLSRLVYDPFPAPVEVRIPGEVLEVEGFMAVEKERFVIPGLSFWEALRIEEDRWVSPNPAFTYLKSLRGDTSSSFDLEAYLARPRHRSPAPPEWEIREVLARSLQSAPVYRLRWRAPTEGD